MGGYQGAPNPEAQADARGAQNLRKIEHIVVLMLENRSFDHLLGYLSLPVDRGGRGRSDVDGLKGLEFNQLSPGAKVRVHRLPSTVFPFDPPHATPAAVKRQVGLAGWLDGDPPHMGGFVRRCDESLRVKGLRDEHDPGDVMGYHTADQVPVYDFLAQHFAVCDKWFSSVPSGTWPNRMFLYAGTSNGIVTNPKSIANYGPEYDDMPERLLIHVLDEHNVSWRIYRHDFSWMGLFRSFDPVIASTSRVDEFGRFLARCREDRLPAVSFIDPNWSDFGAHSAINDDHPPEGDLADGQQLVGTVYEAIRRGANNLAAKTLLIVTYDEHGGFYDHVFPPDVPAFGYNTGDHEALTRFGVRVPALVVSPLIPPGTVSHVRFDHASIVKTILLRFCGDKSISTLERGGRRVRVARNLGALLSLPNPRTSLPSAADRIPGGYRGTSAAQARRSEFCEEMAQARAVARG